jgi:sterol desaturase/sphingolipid hydroxylase (fatty acid hydroxylase superfamily)
VRKYIMAPLWLSLSSAAILWLVVFALMRSWAASSWMLAGVIAGYLAYERIHLRIHSPAAGGKLLRALRKHHFHHHFANEHASYGVTSPLWDLLLATLPSDRPRDLIAGADQRRSAGFQPRQ